MTKEEKRALFDQAWKEVLGVNDAKDEDSFLMLAVILSREFNLSDGSSRRDLNLIC